VSRKVVFDAIVYLQAVANPAGPSGACFDHVRSGTLALITSSETVAELRGLLARPNIRKKFPHLTDQMAEELVTEVERISTSLDDVPRVFEYPRDPKDEPYINLAIAADADYLTSRDKDLLDLADGMRQREPGWRLLWEKSVCQPRRHLGADPGEKTTRPGGLVVGIFFDDPAADLRGIHRQERASVHGSVGAVVLQPLDDEVLALSIETPDLGDFESGIDSRPINLRGGHVDFDPEIGVGIVGDVQGSPRLASGHSIQLIGMEEIAFIGLQTARDIGPLPGRLTSAHERYLTFFRN